MNKIEIWTKKKIQIYSEWQWKWKLKNYHDFYQLLPIIYRAKYENAWEGIFPEEWD